MLYNGRLKKYFVLFVFVTIFLEPVILFSENENSELTINDVPELTFSKKVYFSEVNDYFDLFSFNIDNIDHFFGTFQSNGLKLVCHVFRPEKYKATIVILHGYLHHCAQMSSFIRFLTDNNYAVAIYDARGHGLSEGKRADIDDFNIYYNDLINFTEIVKLNLSGPYYLIGYSMGGAVAIQYILSGNLYGYDKFVLVNPLIHSSHWFLSNIGRKLFFWVNDVKRVDSLATGNKEYLNFIRENDYLQVREVPMNWYDSLFDWNNNIVEYSPTCIPVKVIQTTKDKVLDWEYNMDFITEKFHNADITLVNHSDHEILNTVSPYKKEVYQLINSYLEE